MSEEARTAYRATLARNLLLAKALDDVLDACARALVPIQPLKGALLVETAYGGDFGARPMSDLDLLVLPQHVEPAAAILREFGYAQVGDGVRYEPEHTHHRVFVRNGVCIELHHELCHLVGFDGSPFDFFSDVREICFRGRPLQVAREEWQVFFTLLHAAQHAYLHHRAWIVDVILQLRAAPDLDLTEVWRIAKRRGVSRMVAAAARLVEAHAPGILSSPTARGIRDHALDQLLATTTARVVSPSLRSVAINLLMLERPRDALRYLATKGALRAQEAWERITAARA